MTVAIRRSEDSSEEYLLPLMVAVGAGGRGDRIFNDRVMCRKYLRSSLTEG